MGRECKTGINDVRTKRPDIAKLMDNYNAYHNITNSNNPDCISHSGKTIIYCRCDQGHDFSQIANKLNKRKQDDTGSLYCPICLEKGLQKIPYMPRKTWKISLKDFCENNFEFKYLLDEWDYEQNNETGIYPDKVGYGSNINANWICPLGHKYKARISHRTDGQQCPYCSGAKLLKGFNDLESQYPEVVKDWDFERNIDKPNEVFAHANKKAYWKCHKCGNEWQAQISHRTSKNHPTGCPKCRNHGMSVIELCIYLTIKEHFPDAEYRKKIDGIEFDIYIDTIPMGIEYDGIYYHGPSKSKRDRKKDIKSKEKGFCFLRIKETLKKEKHLVFENNVLYIYTNFNTKYTKICEGVLHCIKENYCQDINILVPENIIAKAKEIMTLKVVENSLAIKFPDVAKELHPTKNGPIKAEYIAAHSHDPLWWKCSKCGYEYEKPVHRRTDIGPHKKSGCPCCSGQILIPGRTDLLTTCPEIKNYWDYSKNEARGIKPEDFMKTSRQKAHFTFNKKEIEMQIRSAVLKILKLK